jgi:hypothetical protein
MNPYIKWPLIAVCVLSAMSLVREYAKLKSAKETT